MSWTTITLRTTTPVFNGDDGQIRVSSLRGAMRYWFRALVGTRVGNDLTTLSAVEEQVFGSLTCPSPVQIRLPEPPKTKDKGTPIQKVLDLSSLEAQWIIYLMGQGLATHDKKQKKFLFAKRYVSNETFTLKIRLASSKSLREDQSPGTLAREEAIDSLLLASLWLMCTYGGVGARTRRGFGGIRIEDVEHHTGALPGPWTAQLLHTPGPDYYRDLSSLLPETGQMRDVLDTCLEYLNALLPGGWSPRDPEHSAYPIIESAYSNAQLSDFTRDSFWAAAVAAGERYRLFRAYKDNNESSTPYYPKAKTPEYQRLVEGKGERTKDFRLGAFGLPVQFKRTRPSGNIVTAIKNPSRGHKKEVLRRASPLWIRFIPNADRTTWYVFSFAFLNQYFGGDSDITVNFEHEDGEQKQLSVTDSLVRASTADCITALTRGPQPTGPAKD